MSDKVTNFQFSRQPAAAGDAVESVIGPTLVIKGEVTAEEDLLIMGRVEGKIDHNQTLTIHAEGSVKAAVKAKEIQVDGSVEGNMYGTQRVKICETGQVVGNVFAPRVGLMEGATFKGMVDMDSDAAAVESRFAEQVSNRKPKAPAQPAEPAAVEEPTKETVEPAQAAEPEEAPAASSAPKKASARNGRKKSTAKSDAANKTDDAAESDSSEEE
ncbi:MAG: polymer-forming cytoskeletal protein [Gammaproteobacteria bacterium]|nr:polymer-forming cytoskeletal protein [Gammaproteobacteria bacterium]